MSKDFKSYRDLDAWQKAMDIGNYSQLTVYGLQLYRELCAVEDPVQWNGLGYKNEPA